MKAVVQPAPNPQDINRISLYGATALGQWKRGYGLFLGFPLLGARAALGVTDRLDLGVVYESFYLAMNEVRATVRWQFFQGERWDGALLLEGGAAFFNAKPNVEGQGGPRWLTGRRNWNVSPGFVFSYRGASLKSPRVFLEGRYLLAIDTEPYQRFPLGGVPASVQFLHNVPLRFGAEMPFNAKTSFLFSLGFDIHGGPEDSIFMPYCTVGLVTSF